MILDFYDGKLNGDTWEELCQSCYRIRYQEQHYTEIPAAYDGDAGIEGFTTNGIVNQCYYPEKEYSDDDLYEHQREKMSADIKKLLTNKKKLHQLGVPIIHEWHFVTPFYKDSRIIKHAESKRREVLAAKKEDSSKYDYIADDFIVVIKQAEDFKFEITRIIRESLTDAKLNLAIHDANGIDWKQCDSQKINNIKKKVMAVMNCENDENDDFNQIVNMYVENYIKGIEVMSRLRVHFAEIYEDVYRLEQTYKKQVAIRTGMNSDKSMNYDVFINILDDFELQLRSTCRYFNSASIIELKINIISMWLADCSMMFRK